MADNTQVFEWPDSTSGGIKPSAPTVFDIVEAAKMYFYQNTAPVGWTIDAAVADCCLAVKGGSNAYNVNGGNLAGVWAMTEAQMPTHTHTASGSTSDPGGHTHTYGCAGVATIGSLGGGPPAYIPTGWDSGQATGSSGSHTHTVTVTVSNTGSGATTYRPYSAVGIICTKDV